MVKWTTPTLRCNIPAEIEFDYIILTLLQGNTKIEKTITEVVDNSFDVFFTQEETSQFSTYKPVQAQLNLMKGGTRLATNIVDLDVSINLHDEYIEEV